MGDHFSEKSEKAENSLDGPQRKYDSLLPQGVIKKKVEVNISYMEIYNETINDLLDSEKKDL